MGLSLLHTGDVVDAPELISIKRSRFTIRLKASPSRDFQIRSGRRRRKPFLEIDSMVAAWPPRCGARGYW